MAVKFLRRFVSKAIGLIICAGKKWSFRVNLRGEANWKGMLSFSLMTPEARDFLHEWMFHRILEREGVLSPRYGYLQMRLNGESLGIYTWEEHFQKQLVEAAQRREGPIVKFEEGPLWEMRQREAQSGCALIDKKTVPLASPVSAFQEGKTMESAALNRQFGAARKLMEQYRTNAVPASEIFDVDLLGRFLAIAELTRTYHGLIWHNQRFYYNPVTARLEPIGFDGDTGGGVRYLLKQPFMGLGDTSVTKFPRDLYPAMYLFEDSLVADAYRRHLRRFCDPEWLATLHRDLDLDLRRYEKLIGREFPGYRYDRAFLGDNLARICELLAQENVRKNEKEGGP